MVNRIRVAGLTMDDAPAVPRLRVAGITMTGTVATQPRLRVAGITMTGTQSLTITVSGPTGGSRLLPLQLITLTAAPAAGSATPSSYTFSSPDVTFSGSGATRTFRVPGSFVEQTFSISVFGTLSGTNSPTITNSYTAIIQLHYTNVGGVWTPVLRGTI